MTTQPEKKVGPGALTPEPHCIATQANAVSRYSQSAHDGNPNGPGAERAEAMPAERQGGSGLERVVSASGGTGRMYAARAAFHDSGGLVWAYRGKRGLHASAGLKKYQVLSGSGHAG